MKNYTSSALLILALTMLVSSCGTTSYYASDVYQDGIYYRPTKESRAQIIATNNAQLAAALEEASYNDEYVATDSEGNVWVVNKNSNGYFASKLRRFDNPNYYYPYYVGAGLSVMLDVFGRPIFWDSFYGPRHYSWYWNDPWYYRYDPWYYRYDPWYRPGYYAYYGPSWSRSWRTPSYYPGHSYGRNVVYTHRDNHGAVRRAPYGAGNTYYGGSNYNKSTYKSGSYGNNSSRVSNSVTRKGSSNQNKNAQRNNSHSSYSNSNRSSSSYNSGASRSSYSGSSRSSGSSYSGGSHSSSSSGGGRRR